MAPNGVCVAYWDAEADKPIGRLRVIHSGAIGRGKYLGFVPVRVKTDENGREVLEDGAPVLERVEIDQDGNVVEAAKPEPVGKPAGKPTPGGEG